MGSHRLGWTVVVCTALLIAVVAWTSPDSRPYSPRNAGPDGHGTFTALVGAQGATGAQLTGVQTVVVPAARELTSAEAATLREVPGRGGTLVLPVGAVPGNQMLEALGVPVRVSDAYVREIAVRLRQPNLVYATSPFRTQVLEARTASALTVEPPARPVAFSSNISCSC